MPEPLLEHPNRGRPAARPIEVVSGIFFGHTATQFWACRSLECLLAMSASSRSPALFLRGIQVE